MRIQIPDRLMFLKNMKAPQKETDANLSGKLCVISGASSGVGFAAARKIAARGADSVLIARNPEKAKYVQS